MSVATSQINFDGIRYHICEITEGLPRVHTIHDGGGAQRLGVCGCVGVCVLITIS